VQAAPPGAAVELGLLAQADQQQSLAGEPAQVGQQHALAGAAGEVAAPEQCAHPPAQRAVHRGSLDAQLGALEGADDQAIAALLGCLAAESFKSHLSGSLLARKFFV